MLTLLPHYGLGGDTNPYHLRTHESLTTNSCGNSSKSVQKSYIFLSSNIRPCRLLRYQVFASYPAPEIQAGKISVRSDILRQMFDFYDQISVSRQYPSLEQTNRQARGIGSNISFWNRLRAICPKGVIYNGPILNSKGDHCTTSCMLDEAMLDTRKFWFDEPADQFREWKPVLKEYQTATAWPFN